MKSKMYRLFEEKRSVHVLYSYEGMKQYIEHVADFIQQGILAGDYVILIENERIYPMIQSELIKFLDKEQLEFVHFVNNLDFYFSSGSYHPPAITNYFNNIVQPYIDNKILFRSWAHVEWSSMEEPLHLIEDFEKIVDEAVHTHLFPLICAYEGNKMPDYLVSILMETHPYVLFKGDIIISEQYQPLKDIK
ncbi:MEDS domain-containing protein [Niallia taxi]|uniref:MEDS domain-containing protein n=1 Tax=Niallia taxi TaxID=2499688 RepID=UPI00203E3B7F|nr:MEDS domain-containing protein [Niallia taxi]MCM3217729.1 MEDS domain-containing protein [Niallia taxi]